jgi:hypothetical protein
MTSQTTTYEIPAHQLDTFTKVISRVAKRAAKIGAEPMTWKQVSERPARVYRTRMQDAVRYSYIPVNEPQPQLVQLTGVTTTELGATTLHTIEITGQEPKVEGHTFIASIDHADGETNIVSTVPGSPAPEGLVAGWLNAKADCKHCGLARMRNRTYLLTTEDGTIAQVGSTCIKDYFPGHAAEDIARLAELWIILDLASSGEGDYEGGGSSHGGGWLREDVVAQACASIRLHGWTPKSRATDTRPATAGRVQNALTWIRPTKAEPTRPDPITDEDIEMADTVIAWVEALDPHQNEDYLWNLKSATARKVTVPRHLGIVVSAVGAWQRENEKQIEKTAQAERQIPVVTGRHEITGKVLTIKTVEGFRYDQETWKMLLLVDTPEGTYKLWGSIPASILLDTVPGAEVTFTATVENAKGDDTSFGIFKRPTKATIKEVAAA